jgi:hypothetical protein
MILGLEGQRKEDCKFKVSLSYIVRPCLKNKTKQKSFQFIPIRKLLHVVKPCF